MEARLQEILPKASYVVTESAIAQENLDAFKR